MEIIKSVNNETSFDVAFKLIESEHKEVQNAAVTSVKQSSSPKVYSYVEHLLSNESVELRKSALHILEGKQTTQTIDVLLVALKDKNGEIRNRVSMALEKITHQNFGTDAKAWNSWCESQK